MKEKSLGRIFWTACIGVAALCMASNAHAYTHSRILAELIDGTRNENSPEARDVNRLLEWMCHNIVRHAITLLYNENQDALQLSATYDNLPEFDFNVQLQRPRRQTSSLCVDLVGRCAYHAIHLVHQNEHIPIGHVRVQRKPSSETY